MMYPFTARGSCTVQLLIQTSHTEADGQLGMDNPSRNDMGRGLGLIGASVVQVLSCYPYLPHTSMPGSSGSSNLSRSSLFECTLPTPMLNKNLFHYLASFVLQRTYSNHQPHCSSSHGKVIHRKFLPPRQTRLSAPSDSRLSGLDQLDWPPTSEAHQRTDPG